jgi:hypothetical protein
MGLDANGEATQRFDDTEDEEGLPDADTEDEPSAEALAEIAALEESEASAASTLEAALASVRAELDEQRAQTAAAVARYRQAALAAAPEIPAELVTGDTVEAVDASLAAARRTVEQVRATLAAESASRGFPAGAPARGEPSTDGMSAAEKIARGLRERG